MTQEEQDRIVGRVVRELTDARRHLACLEAKAAKIAEDFRKLAGWLDGSRPIGTLSDESMTMEQAVKLIFEVDHAREDVERLEGRCEKLGV